MHFAGPVPDEGDSPTELEGKWRVDGICIDLKLLIARRNSLTHAAVGRVEDPCVNNDDRDTMMATMLTVHSSWGDTWSDVFKESSMKVGTACPAFFCSCDRDLKGLCHGDDFCVVARQKQLQTFGKSPWETI